MVFCWHWNSFQLSVQCFILSFIPTISHCLLFVFYNYYTHFLLFNRRIWLNLFNTNNFCINYSTRGISWWNPFSSLCGDPCVQVTRCTGVSRASCSAFVCILSWIICVMFSVNWSKLWRTLLLKSELYLVPELLFVFGSALCRRGMICLSIHFHFLCRSGFIADGIVMSQTSLKLYEFL